MSQPANFTALDHRRLGQEHTAECRKRLEDVMTTDVPTSTQVEATRVETGGNASSENASDLSFGESQQFRVALVNTNTFASQTRSARTPKPRTRHGDADWQSGGT